MSILTKVHSAGPKSDIDWNPSKGWHEALIIGVASVGQKLSAHSGKMTDRISVIILTDDTVEFDGNEVNKAMVETFNDSLHEKSAISTKLLNPMGVKVDSYSELLGQTLRIKTGPSDCGKYCNINNVDEAEAALELPPGTYLPKYLLEKNGEKTGYEILTMDGVLDGIRPMGSDSGNSVTADPGKPSKSPTDMYS